MSTDNTQNEPKQKTEREVFEAKIGDIKAYQKDTQEVMDSSRGLGGSAIDLLKATQGVVNNVYQTTWGKPPAVEKDDIKKEKNFPADLDYTLFLDLNLLRVTGETGKKIQARYGRHKFECSSIKGLISRFYIFTSDLTGDYMKQMLTPDTGKGSISPEEKADLTVHFMTGNQEMAAVLWVMNLQERSLFDFTPEFSTYYQQAKLQGNRVARNEAAEFSYLLQGKGAVYKLIKEEEELKNAEAEGRIAIAKKRIENKMQLELKKLDEELKADQKTQQQKISPPTADENIPTNIADEGENKDVTSVNRRVGGR